MKTKLLLSLFLIGFVLTVNSITTGPGTKAIDFGGEANWGKTRSVTPTLVTGLQSDDAVILNFSSAVGTLNVSISSESEIVYSTTLNVMDATQFSIYTGGFEVGTYLLEITKPGADGCLYGEFDIE